MILLLALVAFSSGGCSLFRGKPFAQEIPADLEKHPGYAQMLNGPDRPDGLKAAFPDVSEFIASTRVIATRRKFFFFKFQTQLDISIISGDATSLRMVGRHPGDATTVLDIMLADDKMRVYLPLNGQAFQGELTEGVSPFGQVFGIEPWELRPIFAVGQKLVQVQPNWEKPEDDSDAVTGHVLIPPDPESADGLERVETDAQTGLPRVAYFARGKARWTAEYSAWAFFKNSEDDDTLWLMPSRITVRNNRPKAMLEITLKQYRMNPPADLRRWQLTVPPGTPMFTLEDLEKGLGKL